MRALTPRVNGLGAAPASTGALDGAATTPHPPSSGWNEVKVSTKTGNKSASSAGDSAVTEGIRVNVRSQYVAERSVPQNGQWFFVYTIRIANEGLAAARLLRRHWVITNAEGQVQEVEGPGVVGETPRLEPGQTFEYSSACPLDTPFGTMQGTYAFVRDDGTAFRAVIPVFRLAQPFAVN